jgi:hypothetical protein
VTPRIVVCGDSHRYRILRDLLGYDPRLMHARSVEDLRGVQFIEEALLLADASDEAHEAFKRAKMSAELYRARPR